MKKKDLEQDIIKAEGLEKSYGDRRVLKGISFRVYRGEIFTIVGPNGSGKTTTMEILEGTRTRDAGTFSILGGTPGDRDVRERIGVALQDADAFSNLRVEELLILNASLYRRSLPREDLLNLTGLVRVRKSFVRNLSGGERQRLNLAVAMVNDPDLLFLDEPSEGLDPRVRIELWDLLLKLRSEGKTILLTTHYMEEAERLSDRVAVLRGGEILAAGSPAELIASLGPAKRILFEFREAPAPLLELLNGGYTYSLVEDRGIVFVTENIEQDLSDLLNLVRSSGLTIGNLDVHSPRLEDVFLVLTGGDR